MYASSTAPIPQNSTSPLPARHAMQYDARKRRVATAVEYAASRFACSAAVPDTFQPFGLNFQYQVQRGLNLLNQIGQALASEVDAQRKASSTGTSGAPKVTPLNPVDTNPRTPQDTGSIGSFSASRWGDADTQWSAGCTPGASLLGWVQANPWWAVGSIAALALATGAIGAGIQRRGGRAA